MAVMRTLTLTDIERAIQSSWADDTTFAKIDYLARVTGRPSRGQCGATALVVQDLFGGDLIIADLSTNGLVDGVHYWNRLSGGLELDLTRDQLEPDEDVVNVRLVAAGRADLDGEGARAYRTLRRRVLAALGLVDDEARAGTQATQATQAGEAGEGRAGAAELTAITDIY
jgi:hypothetical protein